MYKKILFHAIIYIFIGFPAIAQEPENFPDKNPSAEDTVMAASEEETDDRHRPKSKLAEFDLGAVVIKAKSPANMENAGTTKEITSLDIEMRSDKLLSDSLKQVPGMQVSRQRKGNEQFYMRGYDMSKVALLIDGIPVTDAYGRNMDIDNIGVLNVSKIVINKGVSSALYGTNGVVGSINLITSRPREMYTKVEAEYGRHMNYVINVNHGAPVGNFYYWLSGTYDNSNGYDVSEQLTRTKKETWLWKLSRYDLLGYDLDELYNSNNAIRAYLDNDGKWPYSEHRKYKISGKAGYNFTSEIEAGVSSFFNYTKKKNSSFFSSMTYNYIDETGTWVEPLATDALGNMSAHWPEYYNYNVSPYIHFERNAFSLKSSVYFTEQSNTLEAFKDPWEISRSWSQSSSNATWSIWTSRSYGVNIYPSYRFASWNRLNGAATFAINNHRQEEQAQEGAYLVTQYYGTDIYETQFIEAGYLTIALEDEARVGDFEMTAGISYDAQNLSTFRVKENVDGSRRMIDFYRAADDSMLWGTRDSFNPVAGVVYEPFKDFLKLRTAVSLKTCFPNLEAYSKTVPPDEVSPSKGSRDVKIKPEKSFNTNAGFEFFFRNKTISWRTDYFYSKYDDRIERIYDRETEDHIFVNVDSAAMHGIETTYGWNLSDLPGIFDLDLSFSYTYLYARNRANTRDTNVKKGDKFEDTPEHQFHFDARANFITGTSLAVFGYSTFNQIRYTMGSLPATDDPYSLQCYYEQKLHNPLMLNVKISQKIFTDYEIYLLCRNALDDYSADPFNPGPGRTFYLGLKAEI